jgi:ADP-ribose pyrophosphatase YjhB (NUDIX family)
VSQSVEPSFSKLIPPGDERERLVCDTCGFIDYVNPRIVVGAVAVWSEAGRAFGPDAVPMEQVRFLLCKRAIHPRRGYWTLPAGFMETGETVADGVKREAREEAQVELELDALLAIYDLPVRSQVQIFHRAHLATPSFGAGPESLEVAMFGWDEIPWKDLAFHSVSWALHAFVDSRLEAGFAPFSNPPGGGWMLPVGV